MNQKHTKYIKKISIDHLTVTYAGKKALTGVSLAIYDKQVTALIGPSGCGKTTFLRCLNNMHAFDKDCYVSGSVKLDNEEIISLPGAELRTRVGMVFQKPNPFPQSIYENIAYGPRIHGLYKNQAELDEIVKTSLEEAGLYEEVKGDLNKLATKLSGGQQQRLCIARALAVNPEVLLMDEPCSSLDPISTATVENLIEKLANKLAVVVVTHSMEQASRLAKWTAFFYKGKLIEYNKTSKMFTSPKEPETLAYITRRF